MADGLILPGEKEPTLDVNLVEAAQLFQGRIDELEDPLDREEEITRSLGVLSLFKNVLGGSKAVIRSEESFRLNPTMQAPVIVDVEETKFGEMLFRANFNGVVHFDVLKGTVALNSLCLDMSETEVIKDYDIGVYQPGEKLPGTILVPVKSVKSVIAV